MSQLFPQAFYRQDEIEEAFLLYGGGKVAGINQGGPHGLATGRQNTLVKYLSIFGRESHDYSISRPNMHVEEWA